MAFQFKPESIVRRQQKRRPTVTVQKETVGVLAPNSALARRLARNFTREDIYELDRI